MAFYVYIVASRRNGTIYVGMTDELPRRIWQHRQGEVPGFTRQHGVDKLVWYEAHESRESAFVRERRIKDWKRAWKLRLIEAENPAWQDLYDTLGP